MTDTPLPGDPGPIEMGDAGLLDRLVDACPTGMAVLDADLGFRRANARWTEHTGQALEQALGAGWQAAIDADGRDEFLEAAHAALAAGRGIRGRLRLVAPEDGLRWIDLSLTPVDAGGAALLTFDDVTEELEEARRAHELTRVLEASPDLVAVLDPLGRTIAWANDAFREILGNPQVPGLRLLDRLDGWSQASATCTRPAAGSRPPRCGWRPSSSTPPTWSAWSARTAASSTPVRRSPVCWASSPTTSRASRWPTWSTPRTSTV